MAWNQSLDYGAHGSPQPARCCLAAQVGIKDMSGPVGIVSEMSKVAAASDSKVTALLNMLYFGGFIAINLAVMNLLPIPALDGGRIVCLLITVAGGSASRKRRSTPNMKAYLHGAGMILLLALMAVITFKDVIFICSPEVKTDDKTDSWWAAFPSAAAPRWSIQSMLNTKTTDVEGSLKQIRQLAAAGCEIARLAVPDMAAATELCGHLQGLGPLPLVADIHFDYRLAIAAAEGGASKIRINPGNIGGEDRVKAVAERAARPSTSPSASASTAAVSTSVCWKNTATPPPKRWWKAPLTHLELLEKQRLLRHLRLHEVLHRPAPW